MFEFHSPRNENELFINEKGDVVKFMSGRVMFLSIF